MVQEPLPEEAERLVLPVGEAVREGVRQGSLPFSKPVLVVGVPELLLTSHVQPAGVLGFRKSPRGLPLPFLPGLMTENELQSTGKGMLAKMAVLQEI